MATRITDLVDLTPVRGIVYRIKQVVTALAVLVAVYATWIVVPIYFASYKFENAIQSAALTAAYDEQDEAQIHDEIMQRAKEIGIPVKEENVVVTREEKLVRIEAKYEVPIRFPRGKLLTLTFTPS